ncbi:MAG: sigma-70 family RNA polymerase sigma factor [Cyclobacteriaceae bacterium]|nr:sigma-70 family RNA polymerase sigma factor [Cyclobacteriaceae bacterium]
MFFRKKVGKSDEDFIRKYTETGDPEFLASLYSRYIPMVYGVCLKYLKNREDSQDAVMHIYEKLSAEKRLGDVKNFKVWLYVLVKNHCLMQLRKKNTIYLDNSAFASVENQMYVHPLDEENHEGDLLKLEYCLTQLKNLQERCVRLFYMEKKCYREIAELIDCDLNAVKSHIQNGKRNLKICMQQDHEKEGQA